MFQQKHLADVSLCPENMGKQKKGEYMQSLTIETMDRLAYLSAPDLRRDGQEAVCIVTRVNESHTGFVSQARRIAVKEGEAPALTGRTAVSDSELAKYAPDGSRIACLRRKNGVNQIWLWEEDGLRQLTKLRHGVTDFSWLPDGQGLLWEAPLWPEDEEQAFEEMTADQRAAWERRRAQEPIVVEELIYKLDEVGLFDGSVHQLGVTWLDGTSRLLTREPYEHRQPAASPDGKTAVYYGYPDGGIHRLRAQIFALELPKRERQAQLPESGRVSEAALGREGGRTAAAPEKAAWPTERQVTHEEYLIDSFPLLFDPADGSGGHVAVLTYVKGENGFLQLPRRFNLQTGESEPLFAGECPCEEVNNAVVGRNAYGREGAPYVFSGDGKRFYFTSLWQGSQRLYCYEREAQVFSCLAGEGASIQAISGGQGGCLLYLKGTLARPAELYAGFLPEGKEGAGGLQREKETQEREGRADAAGSAEGVREICLTEENAWLTGYRVPRAVPFDAPSADGKATIHGWYIKPDGLREGEKAPAVLDIHGGPDCGYSSNFWFEFAYLAARGLAVVYCDPRGSVGYGSAYRAGDCAYGSEAQDDLLAFLDAVTELGFIDRERCGVTGGSYGGYMTNRLISTTNRFAAAVTQRNLCNLSTSYGTGDMGFATGKKDFTTMARMLKERVSARATTLRLVDRIRTPLLILHGMADYRCSFEQGEQLFIAMKERNPEVPVRFVAFPGENHGLTRTGRPPAQRAHLQEMADWFVAYLQSGKEAGR